MPTLLIILIIAAMIAAVVMLVRGIAAFLMNSTAQVHGEQSGEGPSEASLKSNKMMQGRIFFQAIAIFLVAILFALYGKH
jgi:predicted RND superfamily exporter protein